MKASRPVDSLASYNQEVLIFSSKGTHHKSPDVVALLKACTKLKDLNNGSRLHADIVKRGLLGKPTCIGNSLINMYVKCGALAKAHELFNELPARDAVSWNVLITGYAQYQYDEQVLNCYECMKHEGQLPNVVTFLCILKACGRIGAADKGKGIHAEIAEAGLHEKNLLVGTALVDMYAKCGMLAKAQEVFDALPVRDVVSSNALIAGYAQHGHGEEALNCFEHMQQEGLCPTAVTFLGILKACGSIKSAEKGKVIHSQIVKKGLLENNYLVGTALIDMYSKCGALAKAQEVFDELSIKNVATWNALISGYEQQGHGEEALNCFERMKQEGYSPDAVTFLCSLKACGSIGAAGKGKEIHAEIVRGGFLRKHLRVGVALVDMYSKCGALVKAQELFDELPNRDVVSWTALMTGYAINSDGEEALSCFKWMQLEGQSPNAVTYLCILKACGNIGALGRGEEVHAEIAKEGLAEKNLLVGNALVDMYAKCGVLGKAQEVFDKLRVRDVVAWNALLAGYAQFGKDEAVNNLLSKMVEEGLMPNSFTFTVLLNVCSQSGLVDEGQMIFEIMDTAHGIIPTLEHYTCMVGLFCRAGHFDKAVAIVKEMPASDCYLVWAALLGACQKWGNVKFGRLAFEHAVQVDEKDPFAFVCMSNIYAAAGMKEDADKIEAMGKEKEAWNLAD